MTRCVVIGLLAAASLAQPAAAPSSARTWLGREAQIEADLRTGAVSRIEDIGTGVTRPRRAFLSAPGPAASFAWKVLPPGMRHGFRESYKSEIAAYELDKLLEMHMVPPAVEREIDGETGAAVMWLDGPRSVKQTGGQVPSGPEWGTAIRRMLLFDDFIGNPDRNAGNILLGARGEIVLIDHSRAFVTDTKLPNRLERVDGDLWPRLTALTADEVTRAIGAWVEPKAIDAMFERRKRMIAAVDKLVKAKGAAEVIIR